MAFAFADHREQRTVDLSIRQQCAGQQRKVFCLHGVLQRNAGSGDNDRLVHRPRVRPVGRCGSCQISVGLADAGACVAQGDAAVQHGIQHPVAELDLLGTLHHALGRQQVFENMVDHGVGFLPVCIICIHPWISPIMIKSILSFVSPYLQLAPRWIKGTVRTEGGYLLTGVFLGSLLLSTPRQPSLIMLASALCLIISPNRVNASRLCQSRPVTGFIARRRYLLRVMAHTARTLIRPGGCPYCWYALFKEQRGIFGVPHCPPEKGCG